MRKILLIGGSGFIGKRLLSVLDGFDVKMIKGRSLNMLNPEQLALEFVEIDIIINLAGQSVMGYWTKAYKRKMYNSRVSLTERIGEAVGLMKEKPKMLINASAVGIYQDGVEVTENDTLFADNYLAKLVMDWEKSAKALESDNLKVVLLRFGIVLGNMGGAYPVLRKLVKFNMGAVFGKGNQAYSFIYIDDAVKAIRFIIDNEIDGVVNMVSPKYSTNKELMLSLKRHFKSWFIWGIPAWVLKLIFGEASMLYLEGQKVIPGVLLKNNFDFEVDTIENCIEKIEKS